VPSLSSLPVLVDPSDWLDEELPVLDRGELSGVSCGPGADGFAVGYSPVAELDVVDAAEGVSVLTPLAAADDWDVELSTDIENVVEFRICQNKLNR
jgi:hypothetical protein